MSDVTVDDKGRSVALSRELYLGVLGREPDPIGQSHVCEQLDRLGEEGLHLILERMIDSEEFRRRWISRQDPIAGLCRDGAIDTLVLDFSDTRASRYLAGGWHAPEQSWVWAAGDRSLICLPRPAWSDDATLYLEVNAAQRAGSGEGQRLIVGVNGEEVGRFAIDHERPITLVCPVAQAIIDAKVAITITLDHPDAVVPAGVALDNGDTRQLSFAFREVRLERLDAELQAIRSAIDHGLPSAVTPLDTVADPADEKLAAAAGELESLGSNCELGFVQRELGVERLSLLRFAGMPLHKLWRGLETSFADLAQPGRFHLQPSGDRGEYIGRDDVYLLEYHTGQADVVLDQLHAREPARLRFLARKLLDDLEDATKLFVVKADDGLQPAQIATLMRLLHRRGPSALLWVDTASAAHPAGTVEAICPALFKGYVARFGDLTQGTHTIEHRDWRKVMARALSLRASLQDR